MCGIAGLLDPATATSAERLGVIASEMANALVHRGPDDSGTWVDAESGVGFGHRRLAIVDLSPTGHQPMRSASGRYTLSFNGEVYDHADLRCRLEQRGHRFAGSSDTEVLLAAIDEWGLAGALQRCNAMFALALWDAEERTLSLARDRVGEKPLYYGRSGGHVVFASELKAISRHPHFHAEIDRGALSLYLRHTYVPAPRSIYQGLGKLPAGTVVTVRRDGLIPTPVPFWSLRETVEAGLANPFTGSDAEAVDALEELLRDAVSLRMQADVPVGAFLSGGVDSSVIAALMQTAGRGPVRTFTVAMPDLGLDESADAAAVAAHLGTDHTSIELSSGDALRALPSLPTHYDEPFADPSQLPTLLVAGVARRHVTVALSGDGGDEVFAGYNRHVLGSSAWRKMQPVPRFIRAGAGVGLSAVGGNRLESVVGRIGGRRVAARYVRSPGEKLDKLGGILAARDEDDVHRRLTTQWPDAARMAGVGVEPQTVATDRASWPLGATATERMLYLDTAMALADGMLTKVDRATMAVSLEARVPLLDHRVVELAWRLPLSMKIRQGRGKWVLRQVLDRHVPASLVERPKIGFDPPIAAWLRGPLRPWAEELLSERRLASDGWITPGPVRRAWEQHQRGDRNWDYRLWTVLQFQAWLDGS